MLKTMTVAAVMLAGCASNEAPSCQQAVSTYYGAGCTFVNTNTGQPSSQGEALQACVMINQAVPDECVGEFEDFLNCINDVPVGASASRCDCTQESDMLFRCAS